MTGGRAEGLEGGLSGSISCEAEDNFIILLLTFRRECSSPSAGGDVSGVCGAPVDTDPANEHK